MARNNRANEEMMKYAFIALGVILFLPFMLFSYLHYSSIKKHHIKGSCTQRVYDVGLLWRSIIFSSGIITTGLIVMFYINSHLLSAIPPEYAKVLFGVDILVVIASLYPIKKMAERVAVRYFGVIFDDNDKKMVIPADLENSSFGENLRLNFIRKMGDYEEIYIKDISSVTREKGVNFYIHGHFGSRKINFSNKQKRDECLSALQARTSVRFGRDLGY
ncbi:hypothetical protein ACV1C5_17955 [Aeromonas caviae]|uniref:DUF5673 domain-containing protein n=1 Tax=Aeromonas caviae TaxID=648 RepID=A0ABU5WD80_AERCA|nr:MULTISPECIES: hypothetical protein [Aeromonas]MEA9423396.1 hypothetical protein [Aeromonas caviae]MEA9437453.1 hypothetical protein [Aeromonas caviae]